ncbi:hypothetical protein K2173_015615 [Erythroxylum novogranatense]|uniref:ENTH domain-containing protein n=1 Tax=Erythroxylum novogranatense TaxID=1862640 RepID=A0AAV8SE00_9ROSI|nr:hypothetical protein K2173_015615 [Erythroxylum novogranatense]
MSTLSRNNSNNNNTGTISFRDFKKQASFFLKEKIKSARLALTDVTPAELLTEEATNGNPWAPDTRILGSISRAAFELDDYWRIVEILHKRFSRFDRKNWRVSYNSLIVLEHMLTHGPESAAGEFQIDRDVIREMDSFQYIDEKGFNWGLALRKKSEKIMKLLEKGPLLKEEREKARKLTRGIQGFGSFAHRSSSAQGILQESSRGTFGRSNTQFNEHNCQENQLTPDEANFVQKVETSQNNFENGSSKSGKKREDLQSWDSFSNTEMKISGRSSKENITPVREDFHGWTSTEEDNPLLNGRRDEVKIVEEDHPFDYTENQNTASLLTARDGILQGC